ncbi:MAG: hypothetical protein LBG86_00675, partial [Puniceicoccales bacterium]|nr:hypothetical protein [Puniceicoccales bacterium]
HTPLKRACLPIPPPERIAISGVKSSCGKRGYARGVFQNPQAFFMKIQTFFQWSAEKIFKKHRTCMCLVRKCRIWQLF